MKKSWKIDAGQKRPDGQDVERRQHDRRRFMDMMHDVGRVARGLPWNVMKMSRHE
jgi:hypothetical protein